MNTQLIATSMLKELETAWNNSDGAAIGRPFTDDADFVDIRGDYHKSKMAISKGHQIILDTMYKNSITSYKLLQVRTIDDHCLLIHAKQTLDAPSGPLKGNNELTLTYVMIRQDNDWKIASCQNTLVAVHSINWQQLMAV